MRALFSLIGIILTVVAAVNFGIQFTDSWQLEYTSHSKLATSDVIWGTGDNFHSKKLKEMQAENEHRNNVALLCTAFALLFFGVSWAMGSWDREKERAEQLKKDGERMPCPQCGESIPTVAKICRFCKYELTASPAEPSAAAPKKPKPPPKLGPSSGMKVYGPKE